jgi:hypothetical protein
MASLLRHRSPLLLLLVAAFVGYTQAFIGEDGKCPLFIFAPFTVE